MKLGQRISVISKYVRRRINHKIFEIGTKKEIPFESTELILVLIFILVITSNLDIIANILIYKIFYYINTLCLSCHNC